MQDLEIGLYISSMIIYIIELILSICLIYTRFKVITIVFFIVESLSGVASLYYLIEILRIQSGNKLLYHCLLLILSASIISFKMGEEMAMKLRDPRIKLSREIQIDIEN